MKTSRFTLTLPVQITDLLPTGLRRSMFIQDTLVQRLKLDPVTLTPLADLERVAAERQLEFEVKRDALRTQARETAKAAGKPAGPKRYPRDGSVEEKIEYRENEGYVFGACSQQPRFWGLPSDDPAALHGFKLWHHDLETKTKGGTFDSRGVTVPWGVPVPGVAPKVMPDDSSWLDDDLTPEAQAEEDRVRAEMAALDSPIAYIPAEAWNFADDEDNQ